MTFQALFSLGLVLGFSSSAFAQNLFQKMPPSVQYGMEAYQNERFEEAHAAFEEAQTLMPSNAQLEFNRGTTFFKQEKYHEALQSLSRARELDDGKLQGDVFYNMGNAYAAMGHAADAMASYRQALRVNPQDAMARHNLEFLLSQPPPPPQNAPKDNEDSEEKDKSDDADSDSDSDSNSDSGTHSASPQQEPRGDLTTPTSSDKETSARENEEDKPPASNDAKPEEASKQGDANEEDADKNAQGKSPPGRQEKRPSREEADKILDAFGMDEKSLEPWRFQQKPPAEEWQYEQDW